MIKLQFEHPVSRQVHVVGPAPYFRLTGDDLRAGPNDTIVATYSNGVWSVEGATFLTIAVEDPTALRFEENGNGHASAAQYGPYDQLRVVDGAIRHGPNAIELLARLDETTQAWYVYPEQKNYRIVVLAPKS
jgi:hypothetical protein